MNRTVTSQLIYQLLPALEYEGPSLFSWKRSISKTFQEMLRGQ